MRNYSTKEVVRMIADEQVFYKGQSAMAEKAQDYERSSSCWDRIVALKILGEQFVDSDETLGYWEAMEIKKLVW